MAGIQLAVCVCLQTMQGLGLNDWIWVLTPLEIRTCFHPHRTLRQTLVNLKDHISLQQRAGVVYRIPCGTCPRVYVGQTCQMLDHQLKEHKRALTSGNLAQSAVAEHAAHESHVINRLEGGQGGGHPPMIPSEMRTRFMAHQIKDHHNEQR